MFFTLKITDFCHGAYCKGRSYQQPRLDSDELAIGEHVPPAGSQGKNTNAFHDRQAAADFLFGGLRVARLIERGIRHRHGGAVDDADPVAVPTECGGGLGFDLRHELVVGVLEKGFRELFPACLTIGTGV